jgi:hypothetical protein
MEGCSNAESGRLDLNQRPHGSEEEFRNTPKCSATGCSNDLALTCDLDYVPNNARTPPVRTGRSTSLGFGAQNAALVMRRL